MEMYGVLHVVIMPLPIVQGSVPDMWSYNVYFRQNIGLLHIQCDGLKFCIVLFETHS